MAMMRLPAGSTLAAMALTMALAGLALAQATAPAIADRALLLEVDGVIGPSIADYVVHELGAARPDQVRLIIVRMNTPGGLDTSMRQIISAILGSPVPVATYVAPNGARAASAGTYIAYASAIAAMAPGTNIGAATLRPTLSDHRLEGRCPSSFRHQPEERWCGARAFRAPCSIARIRLDRGSLTERNDLRRLICQHYQWATETC
jgi:membrane-bound ClpP family serine protease